MKLKIGCKYLCGKLRYGRASVFPPSRDATWISDPEFKLIDHLNMKGDSVAKRGYALIDNKGKVIVTKVNDHWGEEVDQTSKQIHEEYRKLEK
ncbi:hypothetical protein JYA63_11365 [Fictibacillus nanhaiensis]|uniref:Alkyl hydroperoxide reductase subunit C/ Thiol specific antioxidant domain-containing protein n=1 Tax=Fictibacillus nanhaiensis TaxID=742169 RepID=A0ABS2ZRI6_9BACL|nr:hypothetical protein [Fictibacillus nanhaiensis]